MKRIILKLECIDDDAVAINRALRKMPDQRRTRAYGTMSRRTIERLDKVGSSNPWVAEITGYKDGRIERRFLDSLKDYSQTNGPGSRGIFIYFALTENRLYEIFDRPSREKTRRRFARIVDGKLTEIPTTEALLWITS